MDARLWRRIQRDGWNRAAPHYDALWQAQLAPARAGLLQAAALVSGEQVLDVACGTGLLAQAAARAVGPRGTVLGIDLADRMVQAAHTAAVATPGLPGLPGLRFAVMDAERLDLPDACCDAVFCSLGLMYLPDPEQALREMRRVLRAGGRLHVANWGARARCGWSAAFSIVDAEVASAVCPLFFRLCEPDALADALRAAGLQAVRHRVVQAPLVHASAEEACDAVFLGGPVALAWSRFDDQVRARVRARYLDAIAPWRVGDGYRIPAEFLLAAGTATQP